MITLTESASKLLTEYFKTLEKRPIRVYAIPGGCKGPMLIIALDETHEEYDEIEEKDGFCFCMARELKEMVREVTIDAGSTGFTCTPLVPLPNSGGCSSCSGSCSGCH